MTKATQAARDTTIAELHRTREAMAARFHGDLFALTADAQARTEKSGRRIIRRGKPPAQPVEWSGEQIARS